jgi:integrase
MKIETLPPDVAIDARRGYDLLHPFGATVFKACEFYADHLKRNEKRITVQNAVDQWLLYKDTDTIKGATYTNYKTRTTKLKDKFGSILINELDHAAIHKFLHGMKLAKITKKDHCDTYDEFFEWCIFPNKWITENPCRGIDFNLKDKEVAIFEVKEAERIFKAAQKADKDILRYVVACMFVGLRPEAEALKLHRDDFTDETRNLRVHSSKTGKFRYIEVPEDPFKWLIADKWKGLNSQANFWKRWDKFRASLGYRIGIMKKKRVNGKQIFYRDLSTSSKDRPKWPHDVMRHTFCSYHYAAFGDEALTTKLAGHTLRMFRKHYLRHIPKSEGLRFWQIIKSK